MADIHLTVAVDLDDDLRTQLESVRKPVSMAPPTPWFCSWRSSSRRLVVLSQRGNELCGAVGRGVVHHDDMFKVGWKAAQHGLDLPLHPIGGDDGGDWIVFEVEALGHFAG